MIDRALIRSVRWPLAIFSGSLLLLALGGYLRHQSELHVQRLQAEVQQLQHQVEERVELSRLSRQIRAPFALLLSSGFINPSQSRASWIQTVARAAQDSGVYSARFEMKASEPIDFIPVSVPGGRLLQYPVIVNMQLAHEGDLIVFLRRIMHHPGGIMQNRYCRIDSIMEGGRVALHNPNLHAVCRFDWYGLQVVADDPEAVDQPSDLDPEELE